MLNKLSYFLFYFLNFIKYNKLQIILEIIIAQNFVQEHEHYLKVD